MSQANPFNVPLAGPGTMSAFAARCGPSLDAILTNHSGASRPAYAVAGTVWQKIVSGTQWEWYLFDGTDDILIGTFNPAANTFVANSSVLGFATSDVMRISISPQPAANSRILLKAGASSEGLLWLRGAASGSLDGSGVQFANGSTDALLASLLYQISTSSIRLLDGSSAESIRLGLDGDVVSKLWGALSLQVVPPGTIIKGAWTAAPAGTVIANGALLSKTTYARLWGYGTKKLVTESAWQAGAYGAYVNYDANQFRIPMMSGYFARLVKDESTYTIGTYRADANKTHSHTASAADALSGAVMYTPAQTNGQDAGAGAGATWRGHPPTTTNLQHNHTIVVNSDGATEGEPRNIPLLACIKY